MPSSLTTPHRIPSLDGLRAVSIALVLILHFGGGVTNPSAWLTAALPFVGNGDLGVNIFFVISGFLITGLLIREEERNGRIAIGHFYVRRAFRIWPAYYLLIGVVAVLAFASMVPTTRADLWSASLFLWNYTGGSGDQWTLAHTWSLAVEEQFYLLWPLTLACVTGFVARRRIAMAIIVLSPFIRLVTYVVQPSLRTRIPTMLHTRADTLMFGCLLALLLADPELRPAVERGVARGLHWIAIPVIFIASPLLTLRFRGAFIILAGRTLDGVAIACIVAWVVLRPGGRTGRFLNSPFVVQIGVRSYSLYLWQQLFARSVPGLPDLPLLVRLLALVVVAEASYRLVETPMLRLRQRYEGTRRESTVSGAAR